MGNAIELRGISKSFGSVAANKNINLTVEKGEILALLGENGSGKTTLMNMLSGIYMPDSGSIFVDGKKVSINSPEQSAKLGIGMVHQHFKLVERFTALENIRLGLKTGGKFLLGKDTRKYEPRNKSCQYTVFGDLSCDSDYDRLAVGKLLYNAGLCHRASYYTYHDSDSHGDNYPHGSYPS